MPQSLGETLRSAREAKGLTIEQLASITKLNVEFLNALESGRWDLLPGQVYLKPFTKTCAEALDLDVKELYTLIDGIKGEEKPIQPVQGEPVTSRKKIDYKLPIVAAAILVIIAMISVITKTKGPGTLAFRKDAAIPAKSIKTPGTIKWERPWQRPPASYEFYNSQRFRLEVTDPVWACIVVDGDTAFVGILQAGASRTFAAEIDFRISLNRNDRARGYLNGIPVPGVGTGPGRLRNFMIVPVKKEGLNQDEG